MNFFQAIMLGFMQGLAEFLPISSSGHLVIVNKIFGMFGAGNADSNLAYNVLLHFATLISVVVIYWKDIVSLFFEFFKWIGDILKGDFKVKTPERRLLIMLIIGTIPAVVVGLTLSKLGLDEAMNNIFVVAVGLVVTGTLMLVADKMKPIGKTENNSKLSDAFYTGCFQALAILPGLSRSGTTMFGGLANGFDKKFAVRFSFLLSIPAVLGAAVLEIPDAIGQSLVAKDILSIASGFIVAAIVGIFAIKIFVNLISKNKISVFAYYCYAMAIFSLIIGFIK